MQGLARCYYLLSISLKRKQHTFYFVRLVKQSQGLPHEAFHIATKPTLNLDRKLTGATIGYNVALANNSLRYNLRLP